MTIEDLLFRLPGHGGKWILTKEVVANNTTLLDTYEIDKYEEIVVRDWSSKVFGFFMKDDKLKEFLDEFKAEPKDMWSLASFHEKFIQHAQVTDDSEPNQPGRATLRLRQWLSSWWEENSDRFRGDLASQLPVLIVPAFYIGDARTFMSITHACFLHTNSKQALRQHVGMPEDSDEGARGVIKSEHPLLGMSLLLLLSKRDQESLLAIWATWMVSLRHKITLMTSDSATPNPWIYVG